MFSGICKAVRRPAAVPSKGALRILYQLAYISSGTAVGVGVLCAEERRRRTVIVQRMVESKRILRRCDRHVGNRKAIATAAAQETHDDFRHLAPQSAEEVVRADRPEWTAKYAELPSKVERGYEQLMDRDYKRVRRRRAPFLTEDASRPRTSSSTAIQPNAVQAVPTSKATISGSHTSKSGVITLHSQPQESPPTFGHHIVPPVNRRYAEGQDLVSSSIRTITSRDSGFVSSSGAIEDVATSLSLEDLVESGTLNGIRSLCLRKLSQDAFTEADLRLICSRSASLAARIPQSDILEFLIDLFGRLDPNIGSHLDRALATFGLLAGTDVWGDYSWEKVFENLLLPTVKGLASPGGSFWQAMKQALTETCRGLLAANRPSRAEKILTFIKRLDLRAPDDWSKTLADERRKVFEYAIRTGRVPWVCSLLSRNVEQTASHPDAVFYETLESIATSCGRNKKYDAMSGLIVAIEHHIPADLVAQSISDEAKVSIATAIVNATQNVPDELYKSLYDGASPRVRKRLAKVRVVDRLKLVAKSTRNVELIKEEFRCVDAFASRVQLDEATCLQSELAKAEILNSTNHTDAALALLTQIGKSRPAATRSMCLAAVSLAKKGSWTKLEQFLKLLQEPRFSVSDSSEVRSLNNVLYLYSRKHTASQTWHFATELVDKLGFAPSKATTSILLESFVSQKALDLMPAWIRYLRRLGHRFQLDSKSIRGALTRYYLDNRPRHALVVLLCRDIASRIPSLNPSDFELLVMESIGFDARTAVGSVYFKKAARNLAFFGTGHKVALQPAVDPSSTMPVSNEQHPFVQHTYEENSAEDLPSTPKNNNAQEAVDGWPETEEVNELIGAAVDAQWYPSLTLTDTPGRHSSGAGEGRHCGPIRYTGTGKSSPRDQVRIEREIIAALSAKEYSQTLNLYDSSLSSAGLPISPIALEAAVEACIRLHKGDRTEAQKILDRAKAAGMNVACATGPMLIHHMSQMDATNKQDASRLRNIVLKYYRDNERSGQPVKHHVGVTAANILINNGAAEDGLKLLLGIFQSRWAIERPLGIAAMSVVVKGFAAIRSRKGMAWIVEHVLSADVRIDYKFLHTLKLATACFDERSGVKLGNEADKRDVTEFVAEMKRWRQLCIQRHQLQMEQTTDLGWQLVKTLHTCADDAAERPPLPASARQHLERELLGAPMRTVASCGKHDTEPAEQAWLSDAATHAILDTLPPLQDTIEPRFGVSRKRTEELVADERWVDLYRFLLQRDVLLDDGSIAAFRYELAEDRCYPGEEDSFQVY